MMLLRVFTFSFSLFSCGLSAQKSNARDSVKIPVQNFKLPFKNVVVEIPNDTGSIEGDIPQGIIYVKKPHLPVFVKVDYKLFLAHVNPRGAQIQVPVTDKQTGFTDIQMMPVPTYDTAVYSPKLKRVYPQKEELLSKYFAEGMKFEYQANDTPRVDTMIIGMWIDARGKVRFALPYDMSESKMPPEVIDQINAITATIGEWGAAGGYMTPKKLFKPSKLVLESYFCELHVIVSSVPLTTEQKKSGASYSPFDYPLNSPANDKEQERSLNENSSPKLTGE
jgi:hypothetical protein